MMSCRYDITGVGLNLGTGTEYVLKTVSEQTSSLNLWPLEVQ